MTAQVSDNIFIDSQKHRLYCEPLESFWNYDNPKPAFVSPHTACWRGYIASWKIEGSKLYLTQIETENENLKMEKLFPDRQAPVFADWYTGELRVPQGEMTEYVHMFYQSTFESDLFLLADNGIILREWVVHNQ